MPINILWDAVKDDILVGRDEFDESLAGWDIDVFQRFIRTSRGPEFHFVSRGVGHCTRQDIRDCVQPLIDKYGYAHTSTPIEDSRQQRFNRLVGFVESGRDNRYIHFRIERLKHA